jgi:hypothetical protein
VNALLKTTLIALLAMAGRPAFSGEPPPAAPALAKPAPARSVFIMPASPRDGRDPFFPDSLRPYEEAAPAQQRTLDLNSFAVKGISIEHGRTMVIINNHTFALGDEGDVLTPSGHVHIRLAEIRTNSVIIDVKGTRKEIIFVSK